MTLKTMIFGKKSPETESPQVKTPDLETPESGTVDGAPGWSGDGNAGADEIPEHFREMGLDFRDKAGQGDDTPPAPEFIPEEVFYANFKGIFGFAGAFSGLQSLPIRDEEEATAKEAAKALYEVCCETPAFQFLVAPGSVWAKRVMCIAAFGVPKYTAVMLELGTRRKAAAAQKVKAKEAEAKATGEDMLSGLPQKNAAAGATA